MNRALMWGSYPRGGMYLGCVLGSLLECCRSRERSLCYFLLMHSSLTGVSNSVSVTFCSILQIHQMTSHRPSLPHWLFPAQIHWHTRTRAHAHLHMDLHARLHTCLPLIAIKPWLAFSRCLFEWQNFFFSFRFCSLKHWHMSHSAHPTTRQTRAFVSRFTSIQGLQSSPNVFLMKTASSHHSVSV